MRRHRLIVIVASVSALLSGCARAGETAVAPAGAYPPATGAASTALRLWRDFPATSSPRPLVLSGPDIIDPSSGFRNGADKIAYIAGRFTVAAALPVGPPLWKRHPLIPAAKALTLLRGKQHDAPAATGSLSVTAVHLGTAAFSTDRGPSRLPAWLFTFAGVRDQAAVLAIAASDLWPKASPARDGTDDLSATIAPDGHTITVTFVGAAAGTGPCEAQYAAVVAQSSSAVAISVRVARSGRGAQACSAVGYRRTVTVALTPALGGRVLIDSHGVPLPVG
jgi:hypothetical protein